MNNNPQKEAIDTILAMWTKVDLNNQNPESFKKELMQSSNQKIAAIFFYYKEKIKELSIESDHRFFVSRQTFEWLNDAIKKSESKKQSSPMKLDPSLQLLKGIKRSDFTSVASEIEVPLFNINILEQMDLETIDSILAASFYFLLLKESDEAETYRKLGLPTPERSRLTKVIQDYFPEVSDFWINLTRYKELDGWPEKTSEERFEDFEVVFQSYLLNPTLKASNLKVTRTVEE